MTIALAAVLGGIGWTLAEYLIHRFNGHGMKGRTQFSKHHLAHHADPEYFAPWTAKLGAVVVVLLPMAVVTGLAVGWHGLAFTGGFTAVYLAYEVLHRRIHTHAPRGPFGRWARRHHLLHHHRDPRHNHGVTSPVWDVVFRTHRTHDAVRIPRRQAPVWLVDDQGEVRGPFRSDYVLAGRPARAA